MADCYFKDMGRCGDPSNQTLSNARIGRIRSIISASVQRQDTLPTDLEACIRNYTIYAITCHRSCASTYTYKHKIAKFFKKRTRSSSEPPQPLKRVKRSASNSDFNFKTHCIFCGDECAEERDPKNPGRWRPVSRCRTIDTGSNDRTFKDTVLQVCRERNDQWAKDVELRELGAMSDLHAADARYHRDCKPFMGPKSGKLPYKSGAKTRKDFALDQVIRFMESDMDKLWSSTEVYNEYVSRNENILQKKNTC